MQVPENAGEIAGQTITMRGEIMDENLKKTPVCGEHESLGARMVEFCGWYMPVQYVGLVAEHEAVRTRVGLFDVSHMGEIRVRGRQAEVFVDTVTSNDVRRLVDTQIQYSLMTYREGTVVDDLLVYRFSPTEYLLVVNAANLDKDWAWVQEQASGFDVTVTNESDQTAQIAVQGPQAQATLQKLVSIDLDEIQYYWFKQMTVDGRPALVSRTGYTGEDGFEIYLDPKHAVPIWRALMHAGQPFGIQPAGLGARDSLRLEAKMPLYGNEMDHTTTALEAGLGWAVKLKKKTDFIGKTALLEQKKAGLKRKLVCFIMEGRGIARHGYPVVSDDGTPIGHVTSGTHSPTLKKAVGMAYVPIDMKQPGTEISIQIRAKVHAANVVKELYKRN